MSAITLQKANPATLTIAKQTGGRVAISKAGGAQVTVIRQGGSAPLSPATANTLGGVIVGANLSVTANGVLSACIPSVSSDWANITGTPTTLAGYGITDGVHAIPNITYALTTVPPYVSGANRTFAGDVAVIGNVTSYSGFELYNNAITRYAGGQTKKAGTDFQQSEFNANADAIVFGSHRFTLNANGTPVAQIYRSSFQVGSYGFQAYISDSSFNTAALVMGPTGSYIDAGGNGSLDLLGDDVTVQTNQVEPGPTSVLNRMMADQLYQQIVRKN